MAIDDLTDEALFDLYQKNPGIRSLVDGIQQKYHVHHSQKDKPDYNKANIPIAAKEVKEKVSQLLQQQKQGNESPAEVHKKPEPTRMDYLVQLVASLGTIAVFGMYL